MCYTWNVTSKRYFGPGWFETQTVCRDYAVARIKLSRRVIPYVTPEIALEISVLKTGPHFGSV